jgi:hypothetical protein
MRVSRLPTFADSRLAACVAVCGCVAVLGMGIAKHALAGLSPGQRIVIVTPISLSIGPWRVPNDSSPADLEAQFGSARECPGRHLRLLFPGLQMHAYFDWVAEGDPCAISPPKGAVVGLVFRGKWRTDGGVRIGSSLAAMRRLYPRSRAMKPGWWDSGLPFVHPPSGSQFNCRAIEFPDLPCAQLAFQIIRGRVAAISIRTGFGVG